MTDPYRESAPVPAPRWRLALAALAFGWACPAAAGDVVIEIDPASIVAPVTGSPLPLVEMSDVRDGASPERTTIGQISLGQIEVVPPLAELVGAVVSAKAGGIAAELPAGDDDEPPPVIRCELRGFSIETPATLLYWDIESRIEVALSVGEQVREVEASAEARTWVYPSRKLLEKVTREALVKLAEEIDGPLRELLGVPLPEPVEPAAEPETAPPPAG